MNITSGSSRVFFRSHFFQNGNELKSFFEKASKPARAGRFWSPAVSLSRMRALAHNSVLPAQVRRALENACYRYWYHRLVQERG